MNILIVTERFSPEVGAAPSRLTNMAEGFVEQNARVDILTCLPNYPEGKILRGYRHRFSCHEGKDKINVFRYWIYATVSKSPFKRALNMFSFAITLWTFAFKVRRIKNYDFVIIQTPTLLVAVSAMKLFKGLYHRKCILNVSDIWPSTAVDMGAIKKGSKSYKILAWCEKYLYRKADAIFGQSGEIIDHISKFQSEKKIFLYRNLQRKVNITKREYPHTPFKIIFAGMLGVAQDVLSIVENVDFRQLGVEFHIVGGGAQYKAIEQYISQNSQCNVFLHGFVPKEEMEKKYADADASIVPLVTPIYGAFPSKIFDILPMGIPILFCGTGEGADFIIKHKVGFVSSPKDYKTLSSNIRLVTSMSQEQYQSLSGNCILTTKEELDFNLQMQSCMDFLSSI